MDDDRTCVDYHHMMGFELPISRAVGRVVAPIIRQQDARGVSRYVRRMQEAV